MLVSFTLIGQEGFELPLRVKNSKINFQLANNLIIIPVELNGVSLSFIMDTGVGSTILFSIDNRKSLELNNASKIYLRGLGNDESVEAVKSFGNTLKIGDAISADHTVFMIFDKSINFSPQMGFPIHGIIGYDFFRKFILDINYTRETIKIFDPRFYSYKNCKKCYRTDLDLENGRKRPIVKAKYHTENDVLDINLLLDSGSSSALWLFESDSMNIRVPKDSFEAFLGKGFNGEIFGKKTKIKGLQIGDFKLKEVTAAFPDSMYIQGIPIKKRQGSIGGGILRRFNLIIDYPNSRISFKKNLFFSKPFFYNMSGLTIQHSGIRILKDYDIRKGTNRPSLDFVSEHDGKISNSVYSANASGFIYTVQPRFEITDVRPDSPAAMAGLKRGDEVLEINGRKAQKYKLSELNDLFYSDEGKKIKMKIMRLGIEIKYIFYLKKVI
ncbi:pepsin/retropepsin-like aspartic protease family protein [Aquimarina sp. RZ0]|uniref:pepsin/retropepsin-like aspartic protease family protein n=1 Tax=Aquimarina sp. RZ0 TaxID=2607730 RepID=UPI0011F3DE04|nr:aspartyl protease family protein [Aquimarina sp. RZ0]KAA1246736.1 PDZ domain-containing protein [Aquimarina sp. RZ0]